MSLSDRVLRLPPILASALLLAAIAFSGPSFDLGYGTWITAPSWSALPPLLLVFWWGALAAAVLARTTPARRRFPEVILALAGCGLACMIALSFLITVPSQQPLLASLARVAVWTWGAGVLTAIWMTAREMVALTSGKASAAEAIGTAFLIFFAPVGVWLLQTRIANLLTQPRTA